MVMVLSLVRMDEGARSLRRVDEAIRRELHMPTLCTPRAGGRGVFLEAVRTLTGIPDLTPIALLG